MIIDFLCTDLLSKSSIKPMRGKSQYNNNDKYLPGTIVPNEEFLLVAFAKLDKNELGHLTYDEYIECINVFGNKLIYIMVQMMCLFRFLVQELLLVLIRN